MHLLLGLAVNRYAPPELNLLMLPLQLNSITQILDVVPTGLGLGRCYGHVTVTSLYTHGPDRCFQSLSFVYL